MLRRRSPSLPVVSTRVGAEGLELTPGGELVVTESVEGMAEALVCCLREPRPALAMAERGRRVVLERYDWGALARKLEAVWEDCARREPAAPVRAALVGTVCSGSRVE